MRKHWPLRQTCSKEPTCGNDVHIEIECITFKINILRETGSAFGMISDSIQNITYKISIYAD